MESGIQAISLGVIDQEFEMSSHEKDRAMQQFEARQDRANHNRGTRLLVIPPGQDCLGQNVSIGRLQDAGATRGVGTNSNV